MFAISILTPKRVYAIKNLHVTKVADSDLTDENTNDFQVAGGGDPVRVAGLAVPAVGK